MFNKQYKMMWCLGEWIQVHVLNNTHRIVFFLFCTLNHSLLSMSLFVVHAFVHISSSYNAIWFSVQFLLWNWFSIETSSTGMLTMLSKILLRIFFSFQNNTVSFSNIINLAWGWLQICWQTTIARVYKCTSLHTITGVVKLGNFSIHN